MTVLSPADGTQSPSLLPVNLGRTFCCIGDMHFGNASDDGTDSADRVARILPSLGHPLVPRPAAFVQVGDTSEDGTTTEINQAKAFFTTLPAGVPQVVTHGNHDVDLASKTASVWASTMGFSGPNRVQDLGDDLRFIIFGADLDADVNDGITQIISAATLTWLDGALTACDATGRRAVIVTHAPLYNTVLATPTNSFTTLNAQWHAVSVDSKGFTVGTVNTGTSGTMTLDTVPSSWPATGTILVTNSGGSGQQRTLAYTARTTGANGTVTFTGAGGSTSMSAASTVRLDDQSAALKTILGNHACTKLYLCGHTHSPKDAPGFVSSVALTGSAAHSIAVVNASSPFYLSGGGLKRWTDPIITYWPTLYDDRVEVRAFDHGAGVWTDISGARVTTVTL